MENYRDYINQVVYQLGTYLINDKIVILGEDFENSIIYLYFVALLINNNNYKPFDSGLNSCNEEFKKIIFLKNESNYTIGINNRKILKVIRDSFVHGSGDFRLKNNHIIISNNPRPNNPEKNKNTTIMIDKKDLIRLLKKVTLCMNNDDNEFIKEYLNYVSKIELEKEISNKKFGYLLLMSLLFSYNKEGLYDKYMKFLDSSVDLSEMEITDTRLLSDESGKNIKAFYEDNIMIFQTLEETLLFSKELLLLAKNGYFIDKCTEGDKTLWNPKLMPVDKENNIHIPNSLIMSHVRNALSHGYIRFTEDNIIMHDYNKKSGNYFNMQISYEKLKEILTNNYFKEGIKTLTNAHENMAGNYYRTEISLSKHSFAEFISVYKKRFPQKNEKELIDYMLNNHKISTYLFENPSCIKEFSTFILSENKCLLVEYISKIYGENDFWTNLESAKKIWWENSKIGIAKFADFLKGNDDSFLISQLIYFENRYSFQSEEDIKKRITSDDLKNLKRKTLLPTLLSFKNNDCFQQLIFGNYLNNSNELDRILCAIVYHEKFLISYNADVETDYLDVDSIYESSTAFKKSEIFNVNEKQINSVLRKMKFEINILDFFKNKPFINGDNLMEIYRKLAYKKESDSAIWLWIDSLRRDKINEKSR